ncbi:NAD(P)-dependent oxidoreductase [Streptomyces sp. NPDC051976]|uniref:NAD-dependent epimerase/dehydratase family protein n=1 Tax=Streptomyces sp. NPDC051976 TaxID=3154947 RepID=UPI003421C369
MRVFLAGATGVIGRRLVPLLVAQGHRVTGLARTAEGRAALHARGAEAVVADVFDPDALARGMREAAPEVVMHQLTALSGGSSEANARIRRVGSRNLVDAALAAGARRIVAQSIAWTYQPGAEPATEDVPLDLGADEPRRTTVAAVDALERTVRELPESVVLRYGMLYGPGTWYAPGALMADRARAGALAADADVTSFLHVDDAAAAATQALAWPSGAYNVCDDTPAAAREWVPAFCRAVGAPPPEENAGTARTPWARGADNAHARTELGWTPQFPSWRDGFTDPVTWRNAGDAWGGGR